MRKFLSLLVISCMLLLVSGCGCEKKKEKENDNTVESQIAETIKNFYTDDNKLVYDNGGIYSIVYYYDNNNEITGYEHYYEYKNEKEALEKYNEDKEELKNDASIKNIYLNGKYVVYSFVGEQYEGKTVQDIKDTYSFLIPIYKD